MRILISALRFEPGRTLGSEVYLRSLLQTLAEIKGDEQIAVVASAECCQWGESLTSNFEWIPQRIPSSPIARLLYENNKVTQAKEKWEADVVLFPFNTMPRVAFPGVLVVHDMVNDFYSKHYPRFKPFYYRPLRRIVRNSIARADAIVTDSNTIRDEVVASRLPKHAHKVFGAPLAPDSPCAEAVRPNDLPDDGRLIILQPGAHLPHKNHLTGIQALSELRRLFPETFSRVRLVLTGGFFKDHNLMKYVEREDLAGNISFLGKVPPPELEWLMQKAVLISFPSLYEGFGLGTVEAQLHGVPVIASDIPVMREVSGGAAVFVEPKNAAAWAEGIHRLTNDEAERQDLINNGLKNAKGLNWQNHARTILKVLRQIAEEKQSNKKR